MSSAGNDTLGALGQGAITGVQHRIARMDCIVCNNDVLASYIADERLNLYGVRRKTLLHK